ncbi:zinc-dependent metalloprotease family protein [Rothia nasisuis]|uniref:zinc-dependent metalloprotease family protein n=1 Tax=Rothia nasisuis TaxID=2109647 RepID=UPI001F310954|nr:zinc-dependent metalloprotease family protein [Rothia nasisuis]
MKKRILSMAAKSVVTSLLLIALPWASAAHANLTDTDGDKLPDTWETSGYDANSDGVIDIDFPALGASPYRKDLFVEMDWMPRADGGIELAPVEDLDRIVDVFAKYPIRNPDGSTGITLHLDAGDARGDRYNLGGGNQVEYNRLNNHLNDLTTIKNQPGNFDSARGGIFYYMIWGDLYSNGSSSGIAWMNGMDFLVTVGQTYYGRGSSNIRVGTFIHEFGHNLGLGHGGADAVNYKPHYLSVMNYAYQFTGVPKQGGLNYFGFSQRTGLTLDENAVNEAVGLGSASAGYTYTNSRFSLRRALAHKNLDLNQNGTIDADPIQVDLNNDGQFTQLSAPNDLLLMRFQTRAYAGGATPDQEHDLQIHPNELTADDARALNLIP